MQYSKLAVVVAIAAPFVGAQLGGLPACAVSLIHLTWHLYSRHSLTSTIANSSSQQHQLDWLPADRRQMYLQRFLILVGPAATDLLHLQPS